MRAGKFVVGKQWIVTGTDDGIVRVISYETLSIVAEFKAHKDFIRSDALAILSKV